MKLVHLKHRCLLLLVLLVVSSKKTSQATQEDPFHRSGDEYLPMCIRKPTPKYHTADNVCQRDQLNSEYWQQVRTRRYQQLLEDGVYHIPDERTVYCPEAIENWEIGQVGHDTRFIFDNVGSTTAVIIFFREGIEYSASNPAITPPYEDPTAILQPGDWSVVSAYEGHVFYARELEENGKMGRILVQHQPGLVPIKNKYGHNLDCQEPSLPDVLDLAQLSVKEQEEVVKKAYQEIDTEPPEDVLGNRTQYLRVGRKKEDDMASNPSNYYNVYEHCNIIHKGFRNTLTGCPINVFNSGSQHPVDGPMSCLEEFKFHLGISPCPEDYMISWESRMKFEPTHVGETWVARLQSNPDIVLDTYTVQPVYIRDCPSLVVQHDETVTNRSAFGNSNTTTASLTTTIPQSPPLGLNLPQAAHLHTFSY